ncbi:MAG: hypothetical protein KC680_03120 [Candidatus Peregrinibacteria bacterium]|nr:hypothetical protein [Candidatus Peregrinibacteria bacterium]MCB9807922.1 hypothetical protein [Candidatus Peribacteria bacterium]
MTQIPTLPSGQAIYDMIMQEIEPELLTQSIPTLTAKYASETLQQRTERFARYEKAYKEYDKAYEVYMQNVQLQVRVYKKEALQSAEHTSLQKEESLLKKLEQSFV